ncbi:cell envelope integrity protein CreD [Roseomonas populi]|uniref:Cell envelope integrity protein CreD n=1 Tax=Roseomonas populi TaxID=3121582 RepID=A0ABT1X8K5_9PROT|nr:cell envelope integrity protein CreD [Roseomonas pecuniae]MCR0984442.1 cell envelope integrity protein CreD [Roseomonas pecuniae]
MSDIPHPSPAAAAQPRPPLRLGRAGKLALVGGLLLVLLLPHFMIEGVIEERESYQEQVREGIARSWGPAQSVLGPVLMVPTRTPIPRAVGETGPQRWERGAVAVLPARMGAEARLKPERRRRGLFEAVIYEAEVALSATIAVPAISAEPGTDLLWGEAFLVTGASDLRSAAAGARLSADGRELAARDAPDANCFGAELVRWDLGLDGPPEPGRTLTLAGGLSMRGTGSFGVLPLARRAELSVAAPWPTPSFTGAGLPVRSDVTETGFSASWQEGTGQPLVRHLGSNWCQALTASGSSVGVDLLEAVPTYRMVTRASKYAAMFLALAFLTYVLFELVAGVRIHLVQYGLLGLSVVLFPLLLLAFGEPLGFAAAYLISTAAVVAQASAYTAAVTRRVALAGLFAGILGGLFGFLYVVLSLEAYALLAGTVALFAALSVVMAVTRRVDWAGE